MRTILLLLVAAVSVTPALRAQRVPSPGDPTSLAIRAGDGVLASPDQSCTFVVRGDTPASVGNPPAEEEAFVVEGDQSPGAHRILGHFRDLGSNAAADAFWLPDSSGLAVIVRHTRYDDLLMAFRRPEVGDFVTLKVPPIPADEILASYQSRGQPPGRHLRLATKSITRFSWSADGTRASVDAVLGLINAPGSAGSPTFQINVSFTVVLPANRTGGQDATVQVDTASLVQSTR